ncbi:MAG: Asp23/Gls24 family envelope stress response protein [Firmicutes bacterium]|nr:Asp23/Gls24 family envelope stress response protein [Bacillota bacterium]
MGRELETGLGTVSISEEVVAALAAHALERCYGVTGLASRGLEGLAGVLGIGNPGRGVTVRLDEKHLAIEVAIVVGYGTRISEVAQNAREQIRYGVEQATGLKVDQVTVEVAGIRLDGQGRGARGRR